VVIRCQKEKPGEGTEQSEGKRRERRDWGTTERNEGKKKQRKTIY
jgi:hypothetical protein